MKNKVKLNKLGRTLPYGAFLQDLKRLYIERLKFKVHSRMFVCMYLLIKKGKITQTDHVGVKIE